MIKDAKNLHYRHVLRFHLHVYQRSLRNKNKNLQILSILGFLLKSKLNVYLRILLIKYHLTKTQFIKF